MPPPLRTHLITRLRITINTPTQFPVAQKLAEPTWFCTLFSAWLWPFSSSSLSSLSRFCVGKIPILMDTPWHPQVRYIFPKVSNFQGSSYFKKYEGQWNLIHCCLKWPFSFHIEVVAHTSCLGSLNHSKWLLIYESNCARCLKITEKVSFKITSEASHVCIWSRQKLIKSAKNCSFWRVFENMKLAVKQCYQTGQF